MNTEHARRRRGAWVVAGLGVAALAGCAAQPDPFASVAELSAYERTATYAETVALMDRLADASRDDALRGAPLLRRASMGRTYEGRDIPLLILADPPVQHPDEAFASGKAVVLAFGNIHAGEVCGKEALPMLVREIVRDPAAPWARAILDNVVLLAAPIYNADGNERFAPVEVNRPGQDGPRMVGVRANAQGLDLNRDYMKLDAPETRAMARVLTLWRPHMVIDAHTTNGSLHRYTLTFGASQCPAGDSRPMDWSRDVMLPEVSRRLLERAGWDTFWYADFDPQKTEWRTYPSNPRYGSNYHALRGHVSVLSEAYVHAPFRDRVLATMEFIRECVSYAAENRVALLNVVEDARRATAAGEPADVGVRFKDAPFDGTVTVKGWQERPREGGGTESTGVPRDYEVKRWGRFTPTMTVARPRAYLIPPSHAYLLENLRAHGVRVDPERIERDAEVEEYVILSVGEGREFQKRTLRLHEVEKRSATRRVGEGWWRVPVDQELGTLAVYLLEPAADDGLAAWGFFGGELVGNSVYPVVRIPR
ncbi:MAG: hypothetical protein IBJ10_01080 [Phycisphaerales bacterium]|nr:hypothetical protein [Phycisphaerales bacterium]